jgi:GNAT superfamily N-acetyltransferase
MVPVQDTELERATPADAAELAALYLAAWDDALPGVRRAYADDAIRGWIGGVMLNRGETWVARIDGRIVGFMALYADHLDQLYLLPGHYRRGIGRRFVDLAKRRSPGRLQLFTFQCNTRARAFYEAQGFRIAELNDGTGNAEQEPDMRYDWVANGAN